MRRVFLTIVGVLALSAQAPAPSSVSAHYSAYRAALAAGDNANAAREAGLAYDASVARDGDGGSTGALAVNLAMVRLANGDAVGAYEPALRAQGIVQNGGALDPLLVSLLLGRSELTDAHGVEGTQRLLAALPQARGNADMLNQAYDAAREAALWNATAQHFAEAAAAWALTAEFVQGAPGDRNVALAQARIAQGAALFSEAAALEDQSFRAGGGATGSNIRAVDPRRHEQAAAAFNDAMRVLAPFAHQTGANENLTVAQAGFASALAWRRFIDARLQSIDRSSVDPIPWASGGGGTGFSVGPPCPMRAVARPEPNYPPFLNNQWPYGVVVLRVTTSEAGVLEDIRVAGAVPAQGGFVEAVERVAPRWSVEPLEGGPPNCSHPRVRFMSIMFRLGPE